MLTTFAAQVRLNEFGPITDGAVDRSCRSNHRRIIGTRTWLNWLMACAGYSMLPGLIDFSRRSHGAKSASAHLQRPEEPSVHQLFPRSVGNLLRDRAGHRITPIGVEVLFARLVDWRLTQDHGDISAPLLARRSGQFIHVSECLSLRPTVICETCAMSQHLLYGDSAICRVHAARKFGKNSLQRPVPAELALLHIHGQQRGRHGLGV